VTSFIQNISSSISRYVYNFANLSAHSTNSTTPNQVTGEYYTSAYDQRSFTIPVSPDVPVVLETPPLGYSFSRDSSGVHLTSNDPAYNLKPGSPPLSFSFRSLPTYSYATPLTRWAISDISSSPADDPDSDDYGDDTFAYPVFNVNNFSVLDGSYVYEFDYPSDAWRFVKLKQVATPVATPVPAPLPILGFAAMYRFSRKLRQKIKETSLS
jgi:hypothetical protein